MASTYIVFKDKKTDQYMAVEDTHDGVYDRLLRDPKVTVLGSPLSATPKDAIEWVRTILGD